MDLFWVLVNRWDVIWHYICLFDDRQKKQWKASMDIGRGPCFEESLLGNASEQMEPDRLAVVGGLWL